MKWLWAVGLIAACGIAIARPLMLVVQDFKPVVGDNADTNQPLAAKVASALQDTGKFDAVGYSSTSDAVVKAAAKLKWPNVPDKPTLEACGQLAKAMNADYVVVIRSLKDGEMISVNAKLYPAKGSKPIWSQDRGFQTRLGDRSSWDAASLTAARTIAYAIATDPLKNIRITRPTSEDPQAHLPNAQEKPKSVDREGDSLAPGILALHERRVVDALCLLREAVDANPLNTSARASLAEAYLMAGIPASAIAECTRARKLVAKDPGIEAIYARALVAAGRSDEAQRIYHDLVVAMPNDPSGYLGLGDSLLAAGQSTAALEQFHIAATKTPNDAEIQLRLVYTLLALDRYDEATQHYAQAEALAVTAEIAEKKLRYRRVSERLDDALTRMGAEIVTLRQDVRATDGSHEQAVQKVSALIAHSKGLGEFLDRLQPPSPYLASHRSRALAANLIAQAALAVQRFVETNRADSLDDAALYRSDAMRELKAAQTAMQDDAPPASNPL